MRKVSLDDRNTNPPTAAPMDDTGSSNNGPAIDMKKEAPSEAKCGSLASTLSDEGVGGSAAQAKDCSRNGNGTRRKRKLRGM